MKRLSVLFVGLLCAVLVFSVVGLADTEDTAEATLVLDDVIDVTVDDSLSGITITQDDDLAGWNDSGLSKKPFDGTFTVNVLTMTDYAITAKYSATINENGNDAPSSLGGDPLYINSNGEGGNITDTQITTSSGTALGDDFNKSNNMGTAGESQDYKLKLDPSEITNDFSSGNTVDFTVTIEVTDPTT